MNTASKGSYASVNGLKMYYEIHGSGRPLVLLHGALSTIEASFGKVLPSLAQTRQVVAIEQQAHGHTADIDRPLTDEQMAEDTAALLRQLKIENADFLGYSIGAGIALEFARRQPDLVRNPPRARCRAVSTARRRWRGRRCRRSATVPAYGAAGHRTCDARGPRHIRKTGPR